MMEKLLARGGKLAAAAQQRKIGEVAQQLRTMFGSTAVSVEESQVLVRGKRMIKRWLTDPSLRFLGGGPK